MTLHGVLPELADHLHPVADLVTYPGNPRRGDIEALKTSLTTSGQYRPIVVNRGTRTGRRSEVLAGNQTLTAARELGWSHVAVTFIDVDTQAAARVVAADNRLSDLGTYDHQALIDLLTGLDSLEGTGYTAAELASLTEAFGDLPDLDALADEYGDPDPADTWPTITVRVPPDTRAAYQQVMDSFDGPEHARFAALVAAATA